MTIKSGFFNSVNGDRKYDASWFAQYFASFIGNGVFPNPSNSLQVVEGANMTTVVKAGKGWINGYFVVNDSDYVLQHDISDGILKRIDRVVMRLNYLTRQIEIAVKKGEFASEPVAPALQRDVDAYELALADVLINDGATQITQAHITDTRLNNDLCGIVHGTVDQVDTTTLFNQYQSWMTQQKTVYEDDFTEWSNQKEQEVQQFIDDLNALLDGDVAANLTNQITQTNNNLTQLQQQVIAHLEEKGQRNGYASLDDDGKVPLGELPEMEKGGVITYTKAGNYTWICPPNVTKVFVQLVGGGGGGSGYNSASSKYFAGESGGVSSFDNLLSASGGGGGGILGQNVEGISGGNKATAGLSGKSGSSFFQDGRQTSSSETSSMRHSKYGAGGNGGYTSTPLPSGGGGGYEMGELDVKPNQSYTVVVGAGGKGAKTYDTYNWGGDGGDGVVIISY